MVDFSKHLNSTGNADESKQDDDKDDETQQLPNIPKDAAGNYDPDKAAPGSYNLPSSAGPQTPNAFEKKDAEAGVEKEPAKVVSDEAVKPEIPHGTDQDGNTQADRNAEKADKEGVFGGAADLPGANKVLGGDKADKPGKKPKL